MEVLNQEILVAEPPEQELPKSENELRKLLTEVKNSISTIEDEHTNATFLDENAEKEGNRMYQKRILDAEYLKQRIEFALLDLRTPPDASSSAKRDLSLLNERERELRAQLEELNGRFFATQKKLDLKPEWKNVYIPILQELNSQREAVKQELTALLAAEQPEIRLADIPSARVTAFAEPSGEIGTTPTHDEGLLEEVDDSDILLEEEEMEILEDISLYDEIDTLYNVFQKSPSKKTALNLSIALQRVNPNDLPKEITEDSALVSVIEKAAKILLGSKDNFVSKETRKHCTDLLVQLDTEVRGEDLLAEGASVEIDDSVPPLGYSDLLAEEDSTPQTPEQPEIKETVVAQPAARRPGTKIKTQTRRRVATVAPKTTKDLAPEPQAKKPRRPEVDVYVPDTIITPRVRIVERPVVADTVPLVRAISRETTSPHDDKEPPLPMPKPAKFGILKRLFGGTKAPSPNSSRSKERHFNELSQYTDLDELPPVIPVDESKESTVIGTRPSISFTDLEKTRFARGGSDPYGFDIEPKIDTRPLTRENIDRRDPVARAIKKDQTRFAEVEERRTSLRQREEEVEKDIIEDKKRILETIRRESVPIIARRKEREKRELQEQRVQRMEQKSRLIEEHKEIGVLISKLNLSKEEGSLLLGDKSLQKKFEDNRKNNGRFDSREDIRMILKDHIYGLETILTKESLQRGFRGNIKKFFGQIVNTLTNKNEPLPVEEQRLNLYRTILKKIGG